MRPQFKKAEPAACRVALGLDPQRPVLLVTGGSQGATGINDLITHALPILLARAPELQLLHLTGPNDEAKVRAACEQHRCRAVVRAFLAEMDWALGAATVAVSRAGGSSLAELAAVRVPAILIPYPAAADNHQFFNAKAFADSGAALLVEQAAATPLLLAEQILKLAQDESACAAMSRALDRWHTADAAALIAEKILALLKERGLTACDESGEGARSPSPHRTAQSASI